MALTASKFRQVKEIDKATNRSFPIASNQTLYEGAIVAISTTGYAKIQAASLKCVGIALDTKSNTTTTLDTTKRVDVQTGHLEYFPYTSATATNINRSFYATADDTISPAASTNNFLGVCVGFVSSTGVWLRVLAGKA